MTTETNIPSPESIKKDPISFSPEEIKELQEFQGKMNNLIYALGNISLTKIQIEKEEENLKKAITAGRQEEKAIAEKLTKKYGQGSLDIKSGTFIPA